MYTVTDNSYTHQDLPAGQAPPSDTSQVDAIHNIFQKMQEKQFNVPKEHRENPIVIQAKLKSDALQAYEHDYESRWGITKFFLFLVRHLPFINIKFNLEKKADQILKDTGRLYLKAESLGCPVGRSRPEFVKDLNEQWLNRPQNSDSIAHLSQNLRELYQNPHSSLEALLIELDKANKNDKLLLKEMLADPSDEENAFTLLMNKKTDNIAESEKSAFALRNAKDLPKFDIDDDIDEQIKKMDDSKLKNFLLDLPDDEAHSLVLAVLRQYASKLAPPAGSDLKVVNKDLELSEEEKHKVALKMKNAYQKMGKDDFPFLLIEILEIHEDEHVKDLKYIAILKKDDDILGNLNKVTLSRQKIVEAFAENNDLQNLAGALDVLDKNENIDYPKILSKLLSNKKPAEGSKDVILKIFEKMDDKQKMAAFKELCKHSELHHLISPNLIKKLPQNDGADVNFTYVLAFKNLAERLPKGFYEMQSVTARLIFLRMTENERKALIEQILSKPNPGVYLKAEMIAKTDPKEGLPYDKIVKSLLKLKKLTPNQQELLKIAISRLEPEERKEAFESILKTPTLLLFTSIANKEFANELAAFKKEVFKEKNIKTLVQNNLKYLDLLRATNSLNELYELYEVNKDDEKDIVMKFTESKDMLNILKFLVKTNELDGEEITDNWKAIKPEIRKIIEKDKILSPFAPKKDA